MSNTSILEPVENIMDADGLTDFLAQTWSEPQGQKLFEEGDETLERLIRQKTAKPEAHMERETVKPQTSLFPQGEFTDAKQLQRGQVYVDTLWNHEVVLLRKLGGVALEVQKVGGHVYRLGLSRLASVERAA